MDYTKRTASIAQILKNAYPSYKIVLYTIELGKGMMYSLQKALRNENIRHYILTMCDLDMDIFLNYIKSSAEHSVFVLADFHKLSEENKNKILTYMFENDKKLNFIICGLNSISIDNVLLNKMIII